MSLFSKTKTKAHKQQTHGQSGEKTSAAGHLAILRAVLRKNYSISSKQQI
jgi:hypothetical protein